MRFIYTQRGERMELIWVCWFILGLVSGVIVSVSCVAKGKHDGCDSSVSDSDNPDRECDGMDRHIPTPEEITNVLRYFRVGASHKELMVLDYLLDKETDDEEEIY